MASPAQLTPANRLALDALMLQLEARLLEAQERGETGELSGRLGIQRGCARDLGTALSVRIALDGHAVAVVESP